MITSTERRVIFSILLGIIFGTINWHVPMMHKFVGSKELGYSAQAEQLQTIAASALWFSITAAVVWWSMENQDRASVGALYSTSFLSATMVGYYFSYLMEVVTGSVPLSPGPREPGFLKQLHLVIETRAWQHIGPDFAFYALAAIIIGPIFGLGVGKLRNLRYSATD